MKKKYFLLIIAILATTLFNSCQKGVDGDIYFGVQPPSGGYYFTGYDDNNYGFPYGGLLNGTHYGPCSPGTYQFTAAISNGSQTWTWTNANYTLYANAGEDWNMFTQGVLEDGLSGSTRTFDLHFSTSSAWLTTYRRTNEPIKIDTTYTCKGGSKIRITGTLFYSDSPKNEVRKFKK